MSDEEFVRRLRERVDAVAPELPVETAAVVPRARRRRAVTRSVGALAAVAVLGGAVWTAGALWPGRSPMGGPADRPTGVVTSLSPVPAEQRVGLIGMWRVDAAGEAAGTFLRLAGASQLQVWRDCGVIDGTWDAGPTRFVSAVYAWDGSCFGADGPPEMTWLFSATGYQPDGDGWDLIDASGAVTATLRHDGLPSPVPNRVADEAQAPVVDDAARSWLGDPAPLPAGLAAATADQVAGRWIPTGAPSAVEPWVELAADGTWQGSDGCNGGGGRWAIDVDGRFVVTAPGATAAVGCAGGSLPLPEWLTSARRLAVEGGLLVLLDRDGGTLATLAWAGPAAVGPSPGATLEPSPGPGPAATSGSTATFGPAATSGSTATSGSAATFGSAATSAAAVTLADLGCAGTARLDVPAPANDHWVTPRQAVQAWFTALGGPAGLTAEQVPVAGPDAATQTWLVSRDGEPYVAMSVADPGGGYLASADVLCGS